MDGSPPGGLAGPRVRAEAVALGSVAVGALLTLAKLVVGLLTGSLGMLSEAAHSGLDLVASVFVLVAVRTARKPADKEHHYGHGRAESLAAYTEGLLLLFTAAGVYWEALRRLVAHTGHVDAEPYALALLVVVMAVEMVRAVVLRRTGRRAGSMALVADSQERLVDVVAGAAVLAGLAGTRLGYVWADSVAALVVATFIAVNAVRILLRAGDELMDRAPVGIEEQLRRAIAGVPGVRSVGAIRIRRVGGRLLGDATLAARRTLAVEGAQALAEAARSAAESAVPNVELVLSVEGQRQAGNLVERVHATAALLDDVRDVHDVTVEREGDGSLHVSLHVKLPREATLRDAGGLVRELEERLREELPDLKRIDIHPEPLEPQVVSGVDVTGSRPDLVERIRRQVAAGAGAVRLKDVELSSREGRITAYVVAELPGEVPLEEAHDVEEEIERRLERSNPELDEVIARVTPA